MMTTDKKISIAFISVSLVSLIAAALFGVCAAFQFVFPDFMRSIPFYKLRPLHVTLAVAWIFFSAVGGIYYYLPRFSGMSWKWKNGALLHFVLFIATGVAILACYFLGRFGGREYWEFPPALALPVILSWLIFGLNYFQTVFSRQGKWPVYLWMWATGIFFFFFTFAESYLWLLPSVRNNIVRDMTIQWKAYGALTGSWNMLVYGTAIFIMEKIKGDRSISRSPLAFAMYFLGLVNLMFGWAHHIYSLPIAPWLRYSAYAVSMTELIILARIIAGGRKNISASMRRIGFLPYRFLAAADVWIFLNLLAAILISIPAINVYTHGTHVTVAHAMGSTIGINTMILIASCVYIARDTAHKKIVSRKTISIGFWLVNFFLLVFWVSLLAAGIRKGILQATSGMSFQEIMASVQPWMILFAIAGTGVLAGLACIVVPLLATFIRSVFARRASPVKLFNAPQGQPPVLTNLKKTA